MNFRKILLLTAALLLLASCKPDVAAIGGYHMASQNIGIGGTATDDQQLQRDTSPDPIVHGAVQGSKSSPAPAGTKFARAYVMLGSNDCPQVTDASGQNTYRNAVVSMYDQIRAGTPGIEVWWETIRSDGTPSRNICTPLVNAVVQDLASTLPGFHVIDYGGYFGNKPECFGSTGLGDNLHLRPPWPTPASIFGSEPAGWCNGAQVFADWLYPQVISGLPAGPQSILLIGDSITRSSMKWLLADFQQSPDVALVPTTVIGIGANVISLYTGPLTPQQWWNSRISTVSALVERSFEFYEADRLSCQDGSYLTYATTVADVMNAVPGNKPVRWVNMRMDSRMSPADQACVVAVNSALTAAAQLYPNLQVLDFNSAFASRGNCFGGLDGTNPWTPNPAWPAMISGYPAFPSAPAGWCNGELLYEHWRYAQWLAAYNATLPTGKAR